MHVQNKKYSRPIITDKWIGAFSTFAMLPQQPTIRKTSTVLVYGHGMDIYHEAKIKLCLFGDFERHKLGEAGDR